MSDLKVDKHINPINPTFFKKSYSRRRSKEFQKKHIEDSKKFSGTFREYCRVHNISEDALHKQRKRFSEVLLKKEHVSLSSLAQNLSSSRFVSVEVEGSQNKSSRSCFELLGLFFV